MASSKSHKVVSAQLTTLNKQGLFVASEPIEDNFTTKGIAQLQRKFTLDYIVAKANKTWKKTLYYCKNSSYSEGHK